MNLDLDLVVGVDCVVTVVVVPVVAAADDVCDEGPLTRFRIRCRLVCKNLSLPDGEEAEADTVLSVVAEVDAEVPAGGENLCRDRTRLVTRLTANTGDGVAATLTSLREGLLMLLNRFLASAFSCSMNFLRWFCFLACCSRAC